MDQRLRIISLIIFINVTGNGLILPLLPFFADSAGASPLVIGLFLSTYPFFAILSGPPLGALSDRYGRRPVLLFSVAGTIAGFFLMAIAQTLPLLFLARIIDGISAGNSSTVRAAIADITPSDKRVSKLGITFAAESLGLVAGPMIGGLFSQGGFAVAASIAGFIALICFLLTLFFFTETRVISIQPSPAQTKGGFDLPTMLRAVQAPKLRVFILIVFIVQFLIMVMWGTLALYGKYLFGFSGKEIGFISAYAAVVGLVSQTGLLTVLVRITKAKTILSFGLVTMGLGLFLLAVSTSVAILLVGVGLMAMCFNILMPTVTGLASQLSAEHQQGNLMGTISSVTYSGSLLGPVVANAIFGVSMRGSYFIGSMIALIAAMLSVRRIRTHGE